jgi:hypothetical protein
MKNQTDFNVLLGKTKDGTYYSLDYTFVYEDGMSGAVGSAFCPVEKDEIKRRNAEARNSKDRFGNEYYEYWQRNVKTQRGMKWTTWISQAIQEADAGCIGLDGSYPEMRAQVAAKANSFTAECVGGGRCWNADMQFEEIYDLKAFRAAMEIEKIDPPMIEKIIKGAKILG